MFGLIRIYEYIEAKQPYVLYLLCKQYHIRKPAPLVAVWVDGVPFASWQAIMAERPLPGRAGLLPGEDWKAVSL